jgi:hypothetical protein
MAATWLSLFSSALRMGSISALKACSRSRQTPWMPACSRPKDSRASLRNRSVLSRRAVLASSWKSAQARLGVGKLARVAPRENSRGHQGRAQAQQQRRQYHQTNLHRGHALQLWRRRGSCSAIRSSPTQASRSSGESIHAVTGHCAVFSCARCSRSAPRAHHVGRARGLHVAQRIAGRYRQRSGATAMRRAAVSNGSGSGLHTGRLSPESTQPARWYSASCLQQRLGQPAGLVGDHAPGNAVRLERREHLFEARKQPVSTTRCSR